MSNEIILVGGSKDGTIAEKDDNTKAINNIVLNESKDGPEYIDLYLPTNVTDKDDRPIYVRVGRYDAVESASYWATLSEEEKQALKEAAEAAEALEEENREDESTEEEEKPEEPSSNAEEVSTEQEAEEPAVEVPEGEPSESDNADTDTSTEEPSEVTEVEEEPSEKAE